MNKEKEIIFNLFNKHDTYEEIIEDLRLQNLDESTYDNILENYDKYLKEWERRGKSWKKTYSNT